LDSIKEWLENNYETSIKSISFLLYSDHGFKQAPYEQISELDYNIMVSNLRDVDKVFTPGYEDLFLDECASGACPIKSYALSRR
jgi:hypothetical protein